MAMDFGRIQGHAAGSAYGGGPVPTTAERATPFSAGHYPDKLGGTESDKAMGRILGELDRIDNLALRLSTVADRIAGTRPRDVEPSPGTGQTAPYLMARLHMTGSMLENLATHLGDSVERLESVI